MICLPPSPKKRLYIDIHEVIDQGKIERKTNVNTAFFIRKDTSYVKDYKRERVIRVILLNIDASM